MHLLVLLHKIKEMTHKLFFIMNKAYNQTQISCNKIFKFNLPDVSSGACGI